MESGEGERASWLELSIQPVIWSTKLLIVAGGAAWNRSLYCTKSCGRHHVCKKALISWNDGLHFRCGPCSTEMEIKRADCDHRFVVICHDLDKEIMKPLEDLENLAPEKIRELMERLKVDECPEVVDVTMDCGHVIKAVPCLRASEVEKELCVEKISVELPCHHTKEMDCFESSESQLEKVRCMEKVTVALPCGHGKEMDCFESSESQLEKVRCMEKVTVALPCGHGKEMDCFESSESQLEKVRCMEKVTVALPCGHEKEMNCLERSRFDPATFRCDVKVTEVLSCKHERSKICYQTSTKQECEELVMVKFPCGHETRVKCGMEETVKCSRVIVLERDRCIHPKEFKCEGVAIDLEELVCPNKCEEVMPCSHKCEKDCRHAEGHDCGRKCEKVCRNQHPCPSTHLCGTSCPPCELPVYEKRACGHSLKVLCEEDEEGNRARMLNSPCKETCPKPLFCGHHCDAFCHQHEYRLLPGMKLISRWYCPPCSREQHGLLLDCGHRCQHPCRDHWSSTGEYDCPPCVIASGVKVCPLGHKKTFTCDEMDKHKFCREERILYQNLKCGHVNQVVASCGRRYTNLGQKPVVYAGESKMVGMDILFDTVCTKKCGTRLAGCGHSCEELCKYCYNEVMHPRCVQQCEKRLLCGHKCPVPCDIMCQPCALPCPRKCAHGPCRKSCSEPCSPCQLPCTRGCIHRQCSKLCHEICDVEPCMEACSKVLACGHPCIGFCGEECPKLCAVCHVREIYELNRQWIPEEDVVKNRFVVLPDCGHIILATAMDAAMDPSKPVVLEPWNIAELKKCPYRECSAVIWNHPRYPAELQRVGKLYEKKISEVNIDMDAFCRIADLLSPKRGYDHTLYTRFDEFKGYIESLMFKAGGRVVKPELLRATPHHLASIETLARAYSVLVYLACALEKVGLVRRAVDKFMRLGVAFASTLKTFKLPFHPQEMEDMKLEMKKIIDRNIYCQVYTQEIDNVLVAWLRYTRKTEEDRMEKDVIAAEKILFGSMKYAKVHEPVVLKGITLVGQCVDIECAFVIRTNARKMMGIMEEDAPAPGTG